MQNADRASAARRGIVAFGIAAFLTFALGSGTATAQLPPQTGPVVDVLSPIAQPQCGNALLATTIAVGTLPAQARDPLKIATAQLFTVCGLIPRPATTPTRCNADESVSGLVNQIGGAAIGGGLPVAVPTVGQVVDTVAALEAAIGPSVGSLGLAAAVAPVLACAAQASTPATPPKPRSPGSQPEIPDASSTTSARTVRDTSLVATGETVAAPVPAQAILLGSRTTGGTAPLPLRKVAYPLFLVPIVIALVAAVLGRGLLAGFGP